MTLWGTGITWGTGVLWGSDDAPAPPGFSDGQVRLGSLTLGAGTIFRLEHFDPWVAADMRLEHQARSQEDGLFPAEGLVGGLRFEFKIAVLANTRNAALDALLVLKAAFRPTGDLVALIWREGGRTFRLHGQTGGAFPDTSLLHGSTGQCTLRFVATDPNILSDGAREIHVVCPPPASCSVPVEASPLDWEGNGVGEGLVVQAGTGHAHWRARITGPSNYPSIERADTGAILRLRGRLRAGESIFLDSDLKTLVRDGTSLVLRRGVWPWWRFPPGETPIRFRGGGTLDMFTRDAWSP